MTTTEHVPSDPDEAISTNRKDASPRRRWRLPLSARLAVGYGLLLLATFAGVLFLAVQLTRNHLEADIDSRMLATVRSFEEGPTDRIETVDDLESEARAWLASHAFPEDEVEAVRIGNRVYTSVGGIDIDSVPQRNDILTATESRWWSIHEEGVDYRALSVPLSIDGSQVGTLVVVASHEGISTTLDALVFGIGWAAAAGLIFATLLGVAAVRRALLPFRRILRTVEDIEGGGDLSRRVDFEGPRDELGRLADAFDRMIGRLELAFDSQRRFVSDASHELRTPLAVVRGQLELLSSRLDEAGEARARLAVDEVDRMHRIVEDLLLLARLDEGLRLEPQPTEVELVAREAELRVHQIADRTISVDVEPELMAQADPDRLLQVVLNLLNNAVRHTEAPARITVRGRAIDGRAVIEVEDNGEGIPADELPHIFDRLYRGQRSRTAGKPGVGLGLGIVASLVRAMNGEVEVRSTVGEGTTFTVVLPLTSAPSTDTTSVMVG